MNQRERTRWESRKTLHRSFNSKSNVIKLNKGNTLEHELAKFFLCWEALQSGKEFVTEAIFENGKRADILVLDDFEAWEVLHSETVEKFNEKIDSYPVMVLPFNSKQVIKSWLKEFKELI